VQQSRLTRARVPQDDHPALRGVPEGVLDGAPLHLGALLTRLMIPALGPQGIELHSQFGLRLRSTAFGFE
jgi:hypothetical protein